LEAESYGVKVEPSASGDGNWLCLATKTMVPRQETLVEIRKRMEAIVGDLDGEYDGWGTPVVK
jgi:hypothetical protein